MCWFGKGSRLIRAVMCMFICVIFKKKINILIILKNTKKYIYNQTGHLSSLFVSVNYFKMFVLAKNDSASFMNESENLYSYASRFIPELTQMK